MKQRNGFMVMAGLIGLVKPLTGYMVLAILLGLLGNLMASAITVLAGFAVLSVMGQTLWFTTKTAFLCMAGFALLRGFLRYGEQTCNHYIAFKLLALIRDRVFSTMRKLCPAKLEGRDRGDLISVITSDIELLEVFYAHTISPFVIAVLYALVICGFLSFFDSGYAFIAGISYVVIGLGVPPVMNRLGAIDGQNFRNASGALSGFVLDSLRGLDEILQYGAGKSRIVEMQRRSQSLSAIEKKMKHNIGCNEALTNALILVTDMAVLAYGLHLYALGTVSFAGLLIPLLTVMSSFGPVVALAALGSTLQNTFAAGNRVLNILEETPAVEEIQGQPEIAFHGASANHVTFSYEDEEILKDVSLTFSKDQIIGITGRSGSGKSTLLKLFMRFWQVQHGRIEISNRNIDTVNTVDLRAMESYMTQETYLFRDSISENLRVAKPDATHAEMEEACRKAAIHDFIQSLPNGYDTQVGELGDTLSGGERQRLGLARAFLHNGDFMLLDEPTSNLDSLNEGIILCSLDQARNEKTIVLVSHRPSTMRIADHVYAIENGKLCE